MLSKRSDNEINQFPKKKHKKDDGRIFMTIPNLI